jgi:hypothetical protein
MAAGRPSRSFATHRSPAGSTLFARPWASMRSPRCKRPPLTMQPVLSMSPPHWPIRRANGSLQIGRFARLMTWRGPQRMGAALTYARRYALFALVGIAGEDDLDAPDLNTTEPAKAEKPRLNQQTGSNGGQKTIRADSRSRRNTHSGNGRLQGQLSAVLRDQLVGELTAISSADTAAIWARRILPAKNSLNIADARQLENAFQARLAELELRLNNTEPQPLSLGPTGNHIRSLERNGPETKGVSPIESM